MNAEMIPLKTKFINTFRKVLRGPKVEHWIKSAFSGSSFYRKIVPPEYLYKKGAWREFEEEGVHYRLDISNVVDHYV